MEFAKKRDLLPKLCVFLLTRHDGDGLECPEHPEGPEAGEVAHLDEGGEVAGDDDGEVEPVPGVAQVRVVVEDEAAGHALDHHLHRVDAQEDVPGKGKPDHVLIEWGKS